MNKIGLNIYMYYRKQLFELLENSLIERVCKKLKSDFFLYFDRKIRKQVRMIRRRLFLQLSEAQSTGHGRQRPPPEIVARWRCRPLIKNLTAY